MATWDDVAKEFNRITVAMRSISKSMKNIGKTSDKLGALYDKCSQNPNPKANKSR